MKDNKSMFVKNSFKICAALFFSAFLTVFSGCEKPSEELHGAAIENVSFRDIPGVTNEEISAIETLKNSYASFTCGVSLNTDSFYDKNSEPQGFSILFYEWLSNFFGIPFKPVFYEWKDLFGGLSSGRIDFTIELMENPERRAAYLMTSPITRRMIKIF
ncbi:MAG: transporter substrate-binding domain-containing protein, partial [Treponema sp.]|nr:transporter substrate-binding domain-containing protein [Treponema sp.]